MESKFLSKLVVTTAIVTSSFTAFSQKPAVKDTVPQNKIENVQKKATDPLQKWVDGNTKLKEFVGEEKYQSLIDYALSKPSADNLDYRYKVASALEKMESDVTKANIGQTVAEANSENQEANAKRQAANQTNAAVNKTMNDVNSVVNSKKKGFQKTIEGLSKATNNGVNFGSIFQGKKAKEKQIEAQKQQAEAQKNLAIVNASNSFRQTVDNADKAIQTQLDQKARKATIGNKGSVLADDLKVECQKAYKDYNDVIGRINARKLGEHTYNSRRDRADSYQEIFSSNNPEDLKATIADLKAYTEYARPYEDKKSLKDFKTFDEFKLLQKNDPVGVAKIKTDASVIQTCVKTYGDYTSAVNTINSQKMMNNTFDASKDVIKSYQDIFKSEDPAEMQKAAANLKAYTDYANKFMSEKKDISTFKTYDQMFKTQQATAPVKKPVAPKHG